MTNQPRPERGRRRRNKSDTPGKGPLRKVDYHNLHNPFPPMEVFSADQVGAIHDTALRTLQELGIKVLLPEAIEIFAKGGATVKGDMVHIGRDMVEASLLSAPKTITGRAGTRDKDLTFELGRMLFQPGAGAPQATDLERGRRPGSARDYREYTRLNQHFDAQFCDPVPSDPSTTSLQHSDWPLALSGGLKARDSDIRR